MSGPDAVAIAGTLVGEASALGELPSHRLRAVHLVDGESGAALDEALCVVMRAPRSYTGEDVVEIHAHGSQALLRVIVERLVAGGARLAEPGEFTRRAFLNGRIDLPRAEGVALLIEARTERAVRLAARALAGGIGRRAEQVREDLVDLMAGLEVTLDFPEDAVGLDPATAAARIAALRGQVEAWLDGVRRARLVREGVTVAIVGAPNAGKSSLLNALVGSDRAIVSPRAGTTRDIIEATIALDGVPVRLLDTAGIGAARDAVEAEGMRRSRRAIAESDILLVVLDGSIVPDATVLGETAERRRILVRAKADLPQHPSASALADAVAVSAVTGTGIGRLREVLAIHLTTGTETDEESEVAASVRQMQAIERLQRALTSAGVALRSERVEIGLVDLREALSQIADLLGTEVGDSVLDRIFSTFCLGK